MAAPTTKTWTPKPHTKAKHALLKEYLGAWFGIMGHKFPEVLYVDGFCGPGVYDDGGRGSPLIALDIASGLSAKWTKLKKATFVFTDEDEERVTSVEENIAKRIIPSEISITVEHATFVDKITHILDDSEESGAGLPPCFVFLDPFGIKGMPFSVVQRIQGSPSSEVFINLNVQGIIRCAGASDLKTRQHVVDLFGVPDPWSAIGADKFASLRQLYQRQLEKKAKYVRYFELKDNRNSRIFCLLFATNSYSGLSKMKNAFWKVDPDAGTSFSDATNPNQVVLIDTHQFNAESLARQIHAEFRGKSVTGKEVEQFVIINTAYVEKHKTAALRHLKKEKIIQVEQSLTNGQSYRSGFPKDCRIRFS